MSVYKREFKSGAKWCVYLKQPDGSKYRRVVGTKKQAERVEQKLRAQLVEGKWNLGQTDEVIFGDLVAEYLEYAQASKAASSFRTDKCRIEKHLLPFFDEMLVTQITPQMVDSYKAKRVREEAAPKTINNELVNLSHIMKMALRWRYVERNVVTDVEKMKVPTNPPRFLTHQQIEKLVEAAQGSYIHPLIVTALHTGMRKSELFNLHWSDVDFAQQTITVQSKADWHTKNYKSRSLQMTPGLIEVLSCHRMRYPDADYVFTYRGKPLTGTIKRSLARVVSKAGLEGVTLHLLRHTFASQLVMAGVPLRDVQELMGHQSYDTTLRYAHLAPDHVKKQVLNLPFAGSGTRIGHVGEVIEISAEQEKRRGVARRLTS